MTNVRRPVHLQLRPKTGHAVDSLLAGPLIGGQAQMPGHPFGAPSEANGFSLSPKSHLGSAPNHDSALPSQIIPHLYVGNLEQTNRETLNRFDIKYILSLGSLPIISDNLSPTSPTSSNRSNSSSILMPSQNSSKDFTIRIRSTNNNNSNNNNINSNINESETKDPTPTNQGANSLTHLDENEGVQLRHIKCKCINIADDNNQTLIDFFDEAHKFIHQARSKKCNILVHCLAGISRSPTIAIAYLMRVNSLRLQDAYNLVKQCRPQIDPNISFMGQLMIYDRTLKDSAAKYHHNQKRTTARSNQQRNNC